MLLWIFVFTFLGSVLSLLIAATLLIKKRLIEEKSLWLVAFAAGAMLAAAFFDLLPEAVERLSHLSNLSHLGGAIFAGMASFFFLERFLFWHHHHACPEGEDCSGTKPTAPLIIIGDGLHNFLDGVTIAAAFLVSFQLGTVTSLAVFFHEIPHEIGNFGVLIDAGMKKASALFYNGLSALAAFAGALAAYFLLKTFAGFIPYLIAFAAGNFIYIASADLIPELHQRFKKETAISQTLSFLAGVLLILGAMRMFG